MTNYYNDLGVARDASPSEIKEAWKRWAAEHHRGEGAGHEEFLRVRLAYEVLADAERRREFDLTGSVSPAAYAGFLVKVGLEWTRGSPAGDVLEAACGQVQAARTAYKDRQFLALGEQGLSLAQKVLRAVRERR